MIGECKSDGREREKERVMRKRELVTIERRERRARASSFPLSVSLSSRTGLREERALVFICVKRRKKERQGTSGKKKVNRFSRRGRFDAGMHRCGQERGEERKEDDKRERWEGGKRERCTKLRKINSPKEITSILLAPRACTDFLQHLSREYTYIGYGGA